MVVMAAADEIELRDMVATAAAYDEGPIAFRYPRGETTGLDMAAETRLLEIGKGRIVREGSQLAILSLGTRLEPSLKAARELGRIGISTTVADARFAKPLDAALVERLARNHEALIVIEEGAIGGFASHVLHHLAQHDLLGRAHPPDGSAGPLHRPRQPGRAVCRCRPRRRDDRRPGAFGAEAAASVAGRPPLMARYPFSAIAGQEDLKLALLLTAVDPLIGGLLAFGDRGTGKSTAVRGLANLLPKIRAVSGCPYHCDPDARCGHCDGKAKTHQIAVPVVDLPLGATEDRVVGALNLEAALARGEKRFEPGLLARPIEAISISTRRTCSRTISSISCSMCAQSGENVVEREGLSVRHPARFVLVGSGNPEEGELRPQLLDRFGLSVEVRTPGDVATWVEVVKRREAFERDPSGFCAVWEAEDARIRKRIRLPASASRYSRLRTTCLAAPPNSASRSRRMVCAASSR